MKIKTVSASIISLSLMMSCFEPARAERPPLSGVRVAGELFGGAGGATVGVAVGIGAGWIISKGAAAIAPERQGEDWGKIVWPLIGGGAGLTLGSSLGVYMVGNIDGETGEFMTTWTGSMVGAILAVPVASVIFSDDEPRWIGFLIGSAIGSAIGATIAFNLTRENESSTPPFFSLSVRF